jgi:hypothetical protein
MIYSTTPCWIKSSFHHILNFLLFEKLSGQYIGLVVMSNWRASVWIQIRKVSVVLPHYPVILCGESCLLVSWCVGDRCDMVGRNEDRGWSRRPGVEDWAWLSTGRVLGGRTIGRSDDVVCSLHRAQGDDECRFFGWASKPRSTISPDLTLK